MIQFEHFWRTIQADGRFVLFVDEIAVEQS